MASPAALEPAVSKLMFTNYTAQHTDKPPVERKPVLRAMRTNCEAGIKMLLDWL